MSDPNIKCNCNECRMIEDAYKKGYADGSLSVRNELISHREAYQQGKADAIEEVYHAWVDWNRNKIDIACFDDVIEKVKEKLNYHT